MAKSRSQPVNLPGARPLMNPLVCVTCNPNVSITVSYGSTTLARSFLKAFQYKVPLPVF